MTNNIFTQPKDLVELISDILDNSDVKFEETLEEKYQIYHKDFSSAVQHAKEVAKKKGFEVPDEVWDQKVALGPRKPSGGKTNSYSLELTKGGKPQRKRLNMQVYNMDNKKFELNMYIESLEEELEENKIMKLAKDFEMRVKKAGYSSRNQERERMSTLAIAKKQGLSTSDMQKLDKEIVKIVNKMDESVEVLEEGVNDPAIFKAVFLAGGPGSGKSFIVGKTALTSLGMRVVNSDPAFERALANAGLEMTPDDIFSPAGQIARATAKKVTSKQQSLYVQGRLGLVIDGTGKDYDKIKKQKDQLEKLGYETAMIFVNTNLETAIARDAARSRTLGAKEVEKMWSGVQNNIGKFQGAFKTRMFVVDNSEGADFNKDVMRVYRAISAWAKKPSDNRAAKKWIAGQKAKRGIKENTELLEFTSKEIKMAIGVASDKRYAGGNMTGAVNAIEKIKKGLSKHKQVAAVLQRQNEETMNPVNEKAPQIRGSKPKMKNNKIMDIRGKDGKIYDVEISLDGKKVQFRVASEFGDFKTISIAQAAKLFEEFEEYKFEDFRESYKNILKMKKEGTWALPDSPKAKAELKKLMSKPIKLGKEGDDAAKVMYSLIGDDELFDDLYVAGKKNPNGDARPVIKKAMKRLGLKEEAELFVELKEPFIVYDTANDNKVVGTASDEKGAKSIITTSELPPMKIKDKKTLKIVKSRKKQMIGRPLMAQYCMEEFQLTESIIDDMRDIVDNKQAKKIKGTMVDLFTASIITQIYDKVNDANKSKMEKLPLEKLVDLAYKMMKREKTECPKCKGKGCEHCDNKGYHMTEAKLEEKPADLLVLQFRSSSDAAKAYKVLTQKVAGQMVPYEDAYDEGNELVIEFPDDADKLMKDMKSKGAPSFKVLEREEYSNFAKKKTEELTAKQKKIDLNKNGKVDGDDLAKLRSKKEEFKLCSGCKTPKECMTEQSCMGKSEEINFDVETLIENSDKKDAKEMADLVKELEPKIKDKELQAQVYDLALEKYKNKTRAKKIASYV